MESDILKDSDDFSSRNIQLGHQNPIFEAPFGEKMEKVSLIESKMDSYCKGDDTVSVGLPGEVKNDGVCDRIKEAKSINEEISEDSSSESSSSSSSSSSSDEDEESSSIDEEDDDDNEGNEIGEEIEAEEREENYDDIEDVILGSDGGGVVPEGPIKSKHEIEV